MGGRINTIMQTCFFYLSGILPQDEAIAAIKDAIQKTYGRKGEEVVKKNFDAVDQAMANLHEIKVPAKATSKIEKPPVVPAEAPPFVQKVTADDHGRAGRRAARQRHARRRHLADGHHAVGEAQHRPGDSRSGTRPSASSAASARSSARTPRIRTKVYDPALLAKAPEGFRSADAKGKEFEGMKWTVQVAPEDCTGCGVCVQVCPAKNKTEPTRKAINMTFQPPLREARADELRVLPVDPRHATARSSRSTPSRAASSAGRCLSTPAPAPAAARRPTSSC